MKYLHSSSDARRVLLALLLIVGVGVEVPPAQAGSVQFSYTTPSTPPIANTSAGVFASDGTLLRTLWSNEPTPAGTNTAIWNGLDEEGLPMPSAGPYTIKVLHSKVAYKWEGVLGNTSTDKDGVPVSTGENVRRSFRPTADLAITGTNMFFANGYNENKSLYDRSSTTQPNCVSHSASDEESSRNISHVATDGTRFYVVQAGNYLNSESFVSAFNAADDTQYKFPSGLNSIGGQIIWEKVIDAEYPTEYDSDPTAGIKMEEVTDSAIQTISRANPFPTDPSVKVLTGREKAPTGIAVQTNGNYLFVAHGSRPRPSADYIVPTAYYNEIRVFKKDTGERLTSSTYTNANLKEPGRMVADNSNGLWVIAKTSAGVPVVRKYTINVTTGALSPVTGSDITGLSSPVALALSPNNATLLIADSGTSQQVKAYTVSSGLPVVLWATPLGVLGGYNAANGPAAGDKKFHFFVSDKGRAIDLNRDNDTEKDGEYDCGTLLPASCLAFEDNTKFWVGDPGNERLQHFDMSQNYINNIMFLSSTYQATICNGDSSRVFAGWLEFSVNYTSDLKSGWTFVRNWAAGLTPAEAGGGENFKPGFATVVTMGTRVFGASDQRSAAVNQMKLYELPISAKARYAVTLPTTPVTHVLHEDGSLRYADIASSSTKTSFYKKTFASLDGSGNPTWDTTAELLATAPNDASGPKTNTGGRGVMGYKHPITDSNLVIFSDATDSRYHLGAVPKGGGATLTPLKWRTAPSGLFFDTHGTIGSTGAYSCNNAFTFGGGPLYGNHIILGAHGEGSHDIFGREYQANQFLNYWDNGLMVGQFGSEIHYPYIEAYDGTKGRPPGVSEGRAGNAFSISTAIVNGNLYVYHNDESQSSGIHRWKITDADSVQMLPINNGSGGTTVMLPNGSNGTGLTAQYFSGSNFEKLSSSSPVSNVNVAWMTTPVPGSTDYSIRYSGLIEAKFPGSHQFTITRGGTAPNNYDRVRIWIDQSLKADQWETNGATFVTSAVDLSEGKHQILIEYSKNSSNPQLSMQWSSSLQSAQVVPFQQLYPSNARSFNFGVVDLTQAEYDSSAHVLNRWEPQPMANGNNARAAGSGITIDTSSVFLPGPQAIYKTARQDGFGEMGFINLEPYAQYRIRLHLAEFRYNNYNVTAIGERVFHASVPDAATFKTGTGAVADDILVKKNIDIFQLAGQINKAVTVDYIISSDNAGQLRTGIKNGSGKAAFINGLEIFRDASTTPSFPTIGNGSGLKAEYFNDITLTALNTTQVDKDVNFEWTTSNLPPVTGTTNTNYSVRWTGKILTTKAGNYRFQVDVGPTDTANFRLTLPGISATPIFDTWTTAGPTPSPNTITDIRLNGGTLYDVVLEYKQTTGASKIGLKWRLPTGTSQYTLIPRSQLYNDYAAPVGPGSPQDILVDNPAATVNGAWSPGYSTPKEGADYLHDAANGKGTKSVVYTPNMPEAGFYEVKTLWVGNSTRANNVQYIVHHADGDTTVIVDQTQPLAVGTWISLGSFNFNAGTAGTVTISNTGTTSGKYVMADAIRFVK